MMNYYIVLSCLCLLAAPASCGPVRRGRDTRAMNDAVQLMHEEIQKTLQLMTGSGNLPNTPCTSFTSLQGEGLNLTAHHFSSFGCHLQKMSALTQKRLSGHLLNISEIAHAVAPPTDSCSLPAFSEDTERYLHVKCLLQTMDQRITKASTV